MARAKAKELDIADRHEYYSVQEVATLLECSVGHVRNLLLSGAFTTFKFKTLTLVSKREAVAYAQDREK